MEYTGHLQKLKNDELDQLQTQDYTYRLPGLDRANVGVRQTHEPRPLGL